MSLEQPLTRFAGPLRYRPAQYLDIIWNDTRDANALPNACPQYLVSEGIEEQGVKLDEDCLMLNIVKPAGNITGIPVLVWIHGGSYQNVRTSPSDSLCSRSEADCSQGLLCIAAL
jgi:para-nitrobenzyl esterase